MARISELVTATSKALGLEEKTVKLCARYLREAGLITQKGQGGAAADMTNSDGTNLLLGLMTSDHIKDAAQNVPVAREAIFNGMEVNLSGEVDDSAPPFQFLKEDGEVFCLGDALDVLIDEIARNGDPLDDSDWPIFHFEFEVERPGLESCFELKSGDDYYTVRFRREDPRFDGLTFDEKVKLAHEIFPKERIRMRTSTRIGIDELVIIAECLRGYEPEDGEIVVMPYDNEQPGQGD